MARTAVSPGAYVEAWKSYDYNVLHEATKKEASRQVNEMLKWMDWQIQYDPDRMKKIHAEQGTFDLVRKARNYRSTIYNRNKAIAQIEFDLIKVRSTGNIKEVEAVREKLAVCEDDQWAAARRIMKIYCRVKFVAGGSLMVSDTPEDVEYEYDPEDL